MTISRIVSFLCGFFLFAFLFHLSSPSVFARTVCSVPEYQSKGIKGFCVYPRNFYDKTSMGDVTWTVEKDDFCQNHRPGTDCPAIPRCEDMFTGTTDATQNVTNRGECLGSSDGQDVFTCCYAAPEGVSPDPIAGDLKNPCPNNICITSLGPIKTDPSSFIQVIFQLLLSISGGVAIIMIIMAGYNYSLSSGNPEKLKGAQEMLTAAIIGLVFIIFSTVILEVIGIDILKLPGFTR